MSRPARPWLAGSILLGIMALPTIVSVSEDAISAVPRGYREGSLALGATHWQTITGTVIPAALSGITAAVILGMGRAIGETMAVIMVAGNAAIIPEPLWNALSPVRTLTGTLGIEMGEVAVGSTHYHALFGVAVVLLAITLTVNLLAGGILRRLSERHTATAARKVRGSTARPYARAVLGIGILGLVAAAAGALVAVVTAVALPAVEYTLHRISPKIKQKIAFGLVYASIGIVLLFLGVILADIVYNGAPALSWEFLTAPSSDLGRAGGIGPAIIGTLLLVGGAILFALPIGIGAAIYLHEYTRGGRITGIIRAGVDLLGGTPSIVFGLFGFAFLVLYLDLGVSLARRPDHAGADDPPHHHQDDRRGAWKRPGRRQGGEPRPRGDALGDHMAGRPPTGGARDPDRHDPQYRPGGRGDRADSLHRGRLLKAVPPRVGDGAGDGAPLSPLHPGDQRPRGKGEPVRDGTGASRAGDGHLPGSDPHQEPLPEVGQVVTHNAERQHPYSRTSKPLLR
jgi:ABC-type phosphate transport system permease subunit